MNIYIDIDGTLIHKDTRRLANGLKSMLGYLVETHKLYWLTSHCRGHVEHLNYYLDVHIQDIEVRQLLYSVEPTNWDALKTDAINFNSPFLWLDDFLLEAERRVLAKNFAHYSWVKTDLKSNPNSLIDVLDLIKTLDIAYSPLPHSS